MDGGILVTIATVNVYWCKIPTHIPSKIPNSKSCKTLA